MDFDKINTLFPRQEDCIEFLEKIVWQSEPVCPYCNSMKSTKIKDQYRYHCNNCNTAYSVRVNTLFHDTHLGLQKWFLAIVIVVGDQTNYSSRKLAKELKINKNTACNMLSKIRKALVQRTQREILLKIAAIK